MLLFSLLHNLRTGEIPPTARTNEQELELIRKEPPPAVATSAVAAWALVAAEVRRL